MSPSVLFVWRRFPPPFLIGGAEVSQALLAEQLAQAGWSVTYVGSHEPPWGGASKLAEFEDQLSGWSVEYESDPNTSTLAYSWRGVECICTPQSYAREARRALLADRGILFGECNLNHDGRMTDWKIHSVYHRHK